VCSYFKPGRNTIVEERQPHIQCLPGDIAPFVLLPGDPGRIDAIAAQLDRWEPVACNREYRTITGTFRGMPVSATSTGIGGPSTAIAAEELIRIGARVLIRVGSAGALQPHIRVGDLLIAVGAVREEGASAMYVPVHYPAVSDHSVLAALVEAAAKLGVTAHAGVVRSHDSFYTDREDEITRFWAGKGVLGSDMETATLLTVARLRGARAGSVLNVVVPAEGGLEEGINDLVAGKEAAHKGETAEIQVALHALHALWTVETR